jgi:biotin carboxyl carrier protein
MKSYTITVNGNVYDVTVEENGAVSAPAAAPRRAAAPAPAFCRSSSRSPLRPCPRRSSRSPAPAAAPKAAAPAGGAGNVKIEAGAAGKVFKIESSVGASVKKGDTILVLEIMKMETPVVATEDGTVASINVSVGDMVEAGALLATLNN